MGVLPMRREGVQLVLEDRFTGPTIKAAAAARVLQGSLDGVHGSSDAATPALVRTERAIADTGAVSRQSSNDINQFSGRLGLAAKAVAAFGPAFVPISAVAIPAMTGLASALGATILAGGTAALALQGVGDALGKLNAAQLDPTAAHLEAARQAFEELNPKAREFVLQMDAAGPALDKLKQSAGSGLFPGLSAALSGALTQLPLARDLFEGISGALGNLGEMTGDSLAAGNWSEFLTFLTATAPSAIESLGRTVGNLASGLASLWMAFDPLNTSVIGMLESGSQAFQEWADALGQTDGFKEFVAYIQTSGPQVADALASVGNAVLQIVEAIAPLGGPSLQIIESLARAIATIADSPLGTPLFGLVAAMSALSLATRGYESVRASAFGSAAVGNITAVRAGLNTVITAQDRATMSAKDLAAAQKTQAAGWAAAGNIGKTAAALGVLGVAASGAADKIGLANTASLAMAGTMTGSGWGIALGVGAGLLLDLKAAGDAATDGINGLDEAIASGNAEALAAKIKEAKDELDALGEGNPLRDAMAAAIADASGELEVLQAKARGAAQAESELSNYTSGVNRALYDQTAALAESIKVMQAQRSEALRAADAHLNYRAAILDAKDALKENGQTVDENTRAGQANLQALHALAGGWNNQSDAAKNAKGSLRAAKDNFIETAVAMGMAEGRAKNLAKRLFEIPSSRVVDVSINDTATKKLMAINSQLASIDRSVDIYVNVHKPNAGGFGPQITPAAGITVPGARYPYRDSVHALLAPTEEVVSNDRGQADRYRSVLKGINSNFEPSTIKAMLAAGGTAGGDRRRQRELVDVTGFSDSARDMGIPELRGMRHELAETNRALNRSNNALEAQTDAVDRETQARDQIASDFASLVSEIAGQFRSNLFEPMSNVFRSNSTMSDPLSVLRGDIADSAEFAALFAGLQGRGLSGDALTAGARGGTAGLQTLTAYSDADLAEYARLYAQREAQNQATGQQVATAQFGQALAEQQALLDTANQQRAYQIAQNDQLLAAAHVQTVAVERVKDATKDNGRATASGHRGRVRKG